MKEQDLLGQWKGEEQEPFTGWDFSHPSPHVTLAVCGEEVEQAGLIIEYAEESTGKMTFSDVGAFVYYARAVPWEVPPDFSVERYATQLLNLHRSGRLSFNLGHFIIQARKPV